MGEKQKNNRKKLMAFFVALFFVSAVFVFTADNAHAGVLTKAFDLASAPFKYILYGIFVFLGYITGVATVLFAWVVDAKNISGDNGILNANAIVSVWVMVRDTLNMAFILVLLFAAFCTIFQVEKWNLKKVWLNVLINALLVNFSFTIARFIIDISNVMMYYFFAHMFQPTNSSDASGIFASIGGLSGIAEILIPESKVIATQSWAYLITATVFMFIFAITLMTIAIMFVIRLVALTMLIMFSPIGFVGYIFPSTHKFADDWWTNLFKYAFFGPIMAFMMSVSIQMMTAFSSTQTSMSAIAQNNLSANSDIDPNWLMSMAYFSVPIIVLWVALGISQSMGVAGASAVVGKAKGIAGWAGQTFSGYRLAKYGASAGVKWVDRNILGPKFSPRAIIAGWDAKTKEAENKHLSVGTGLWHDKFNKFFKNGETNYKMLAEHQIVAKRQKELSEVSEESEVLLRQAGNLLGKDTPSAQTDMQAIFRTLINNNDHDEIMDWIRTNIQDEEANGNNEVGKKLQSMGFNDKNWDVSAGNTANAVAKLLGKDGGAGLDDAHINQHLIDLGNIAANKGGIMFGAASIGKDGEYKKNYKINADGSVDDSVMGDYAARKIMTTPDSQNVPKTMHRNHFTDQSQKAIMDPATGKQAFEKEDDGITDKLDDEGKKILAFENNSNLNQHGKAMLRHYASPTAIEQMARHKPDFFKRVGGDASVTKHMYEYARAMQEGEADGPGGKKLKADREQALHAAAYTAALQRKSGVSEADIQKALADAKFEKADIDEINKRVEGPAKSKMTASKDPAEPDFSGTGDGGFGA